VDHSHHRVLLGRVKACGLHEKTFSAVVELDESLLVAFDLLVEERSEFIVRLVEGQFVEDIDLEVVFGNELVKR